MFKAFCRIIINIIDLASSLNSFWYFYQKSSGGYCIKLRHTIIIKTLSTLRRSLRLWPPPSGFQTIFHSHSHFLAGLRILLLLLRLYFYTVLYFTCSNVTAKYSTLTVRTVVVPSSDSSFYYFLWPTFITGWPECRWNSWRTSRIHRLYKRLYCWFHSRHRHHHYIVSSTRLYSSNLFFFHHSTATAHSTSEFILLLRAE